MTGLTTHTKKFHQVSADQLYDCPVPPSTETYEPVPHGWFYEEVCRQIAARGFKNCAEDLRVTTSGDEFFGILRLRSPEHLPGVPNSTWDLSIGLRNTNNKRASLGVFLGTNVWVCDNLCYSAEHTFLRKHHSGTQAVVVAGLRDLTRELASYRDEQRNMVAGLQRWSIGPPMRDHLIVNLLRGGAIRPTDVLKVIDEYKTESTDNPESNHRTAWGLFNAVTWVGAKGFDQNPETAARRSLVTNRTFHQALLIRGGP